MTGDPSLPSVSVVIPTYQRGATLGDVLAPLLDDPATSELVVVVDGSDDGTADLLAGIEDPRLTVLWQPNSGAGAARQRGVEAASCDVVLLLDDDVVAERGLVSGHAAAHARQPGRVVLGAMPTRLPDRRRPDDVTTIRYARDYDHACQEFVSRPERILESFWSGNVSYPRELATRIGLGDPELADLFPSEDRELGLRLRAAGVPAVFCPELRAVHEHRRGLTRFVEDSRRQGRALHVLHRRHPDVVDAPTGPALAGRLPPPARWLVTGAHRSRAAAAVGVLVALSLVRMLGALRWWPAQDVALVLLRRVAQADGARAGARGA